MAAATLTLDGLNRLSPGDFERALGEIFESSPWVARRAAPARPFATVADLHAAMAAAVRRASRDEQLALLRAHPDLAVRAGAMSRTSVAEQSGAGLDRLDEAEYARFHRLNAAYREKFGFPFIIAVRRHDKHAILAAFETRLLNTHTEEIEGALAQVFEIARLRLGGLVSG
ncbi:MAG: 2-oxo-4-hydroxy-4-carboxy-5-ureidoimidazoline decarboxylase [Candidatus Rokuibacteriota bacterium]|nr:MAG: 2-oxo-4-hydroxy-4-carboxy-5-ureidoimidazoline decarboxylase [Candidatus Rokubacteria bacterium]